MTAPAQISFDPSELGMPACWFWFEAALDCGLRWDRARHVHINSRNETAAAVAGDACLFLEVEAQRSWINFRSRA